MVTTQSTAQTLWCNHLSLQLCGEEDRICRQIQRWSWKTTVATIKQVTFLWAITDYLKLKNILSTLISGSMDRAINSLYVAGQLELIASFVQGRVTGQGPSRCWPSAPWRRRLWERSTFRKCFGVRPQQPSRGAGPSPAPAQAAASPSAPARHPACHSHASLGLLLAPGQGRAWPLRLSLQHLSASISSLWVCPSNEAAAKDRSFVLRECVCSSGRWETRRSLFPSLVSCYSQEAW